MRAPALFGAVSKFIEAIDAVVRVERDLVPLLLGELQCEVGTVTADDAILTIEVRDYESFIIRLLGFGTAVRLLEPAVLVERVKSGAHRPLLDGDVQGTLLQMAADREPLYREVADAIVSVDNRSVSDIVEAILR